MTSEKEMKKCSGCKYNQPVVDDGRPVVYNFIGEPGCEYTVFDSSIEKRLAKIENRLELLEGPEQVETPKKSELLLEMFQVIADTYAAGEVNEAIQLLRDEIAKAAGHYHNVPKKDVYWGAGDGLL